MTGVRYRSGGEEREIARRPGHRRRRPPLGASRGGGAAAARLRRADGRLLVPDPQGAGGRERIDRRDRRRPDHGADRPRRLLAMRLCLRQGHGGRDPGPRPRAVPRRRGARRRADVPLDVAAIASWDDVKLLTVALDRLERWHRPGLLVIGDAAHAMSPIGGVGINVAVQDAVAAANVLAGPMARGEDVDPLLAKVQERRLPAVRDDPGLPGRGPAAGDQPAAGAAAQGR